MSLQSFKALETSFFFFFFFFFFFQKAAICFVSMENEINFSTNQMARKPMNASKKLIIRKYKYRRLSLSQLLINRYYCLSQSNTKVPTFFSIYLLYFNYGYLKVWIIRNYGYLKMDFRTQTKIFICFNTAYLKV